MRTKAIKKIIEKAINNENSTHSFANLAKEVAEGNGKSLSEGEAENVTNMVLGYVKCVPTLLEEGYKAAQQFGIQNEMNQMLRELEDYWVLEQDILPDSLGLIGITDDAYASIYLIQTLSDYCKGTYKKPLVEYDFTNANKFIRGLLGNDIAVTLEQKVQVTIANNMANNIFNQVYQNIFSSGFAFGNPFQAINDEREIQEQVNVQMGAMGIF